MAAALDLAPGMTLGPGFAAALDRAPGMTLGPGFAAAFDLAPAMALGAAPSVAGVGIGGVAGGGSGGGPRAGVALLSTWRKLDKLTLLCVRNFATCTRLLTA